MRYLLIGRGKMGRLLQETAQAAGEEVTAALGRNDLDRLGQLGRVADVAIDFSRPDALPEICSYVCRTGTPLLSGTTGLDSRAFAQLEAAGRHAPVLWSANFSLGIAVLVRALEEVSGVLRPDFDIELTETHHNQKEDAPSGTAKLLLRALDREQTLRPVHALRGGTVAGTHSVHFFGPDEELEFTHRAASRQIFVNGALHMARLLPGRANGVYDLQKILFGE